MKRTLCSLFAAGLFASSVSAQPAPDLEAGREAYQDHCARCHGATGAGDGRDAARIYPRPRNLSEGVFKFRTTASGSPPTDEDLFQTISEGLPGSRMPEFQRLSEETRWQLVFYVKSLSAAFEEPPPERIDLGRDPGPTKANLIQGKELYTQLGCNACHGALGRADGPSAPALTDSWDQPIRAADLTQGWRYRAGSSPKEILTRLMTGLDGTPMPSYAEATTADEAWNLAYYVYSLQEKPNWSRTLRANPAAGRTVPDDPMDPQWRNAQRFDLRLAGSSYRSGQILPTTAPAVSLKALHSEGRLALRLSWHDPTKNKETPADAAAVAFLPERRAKWTVGSLRSWPAAADLPPLELIHWAADRETAVAASVRDIAELAQSAGAGTPAWALFSDGEWALVVERPLPAEQKSLRLGVMIWDGGNQEQGRHRASSGWVDLVIG